MSEREAEPILHVVIVSWNTRDLLAACLASVFDDLGAQRAEVWVVDNASSDGSAAMVRQRFPAARLIECERNLGFAAANNRALERLPAGHVLLLNSDTELRRGAVDALLAALAADAGLGAVGARLEDAEGQLQGSCQRAPTVLREWIHLMHLDRWLPGLTYQRVFYEGTAPRDVDVVQGACLLMRAGVHEEVGGFDESYFMYSEEVELCERIRAAGWRIAWVPKARVLHHGGASTALVADEMFLQLYASKLRFFRRNRGQGAATRFKLALAIASIARLALWPAVLVRPGRQSSGYRVVIARYLKLLRRLPTL